MGIPKSILEEKGTAEVALENYKMFVAMRNGYFLDNSPDCRAHVSGCTAHYEHGNPDSSGCAVFEGLAAERVARACEDYAEQQP